MNIKHTTAAILMAVLYSGTVNAAPAEVVEVQAITPAQSTKVAPKRTLEQRLARVENILKARTQSQIDTQVRLDQLSNDLLRLQGLIEESTLEQGKITQRQRDIMNDIERIRSTLATQPTAAVATDSAILNTAGQSDDLTGKDEYNHAIKLIKNERKYDQAIVALQAFIQDYPKSELQANAHYWLGLLLRRDNQNDNAKLAFEKIVTGFPESNKRADSLQKLGQIAKAAKDNATAKRYFEMVIKEYPTNAVAKLAKKELATLK